MYKNDFTIVMVINNFAMVNFDLSKMPKPVPENLVFKV